MSKIEVRKGVLSGRWYVHSPIYKARDNFFFGRNTWAEAIALAALIADPEGELHTAWRKGFAAGFNETKKENQ